MDLRPIRTDDDHLLALREIDRLWAASEGSSEWNKLEVLTILVEAYERDRWPIAQSGRSQTAALPKRKPRRPEVGGTRGPGLSYGADLKIVGAKLAKRQRDGTRPRKVALGWGAGIAGRVKASSQATRSKP